uniref:TIR domain-containing protein n=1 Tax=Scleropages formosus TaxID=113540 RepID=A0A8C9RB67_SCLFO
PQTHRRAGLWSNPLCHHAPLGAHSIPRLRKLYLAENSIGSINCSAFFGLKHLQKLILFRNAIKALYNVTFQGLSQLKVLKLWNSLLKSVYNETFGSLPSLHVLDLGRNILEYIAPGAFQGFPQLRYLYLDRNQLAVVVKRMFLNLGKLQVLDLVSNNLRFCNGVSPAFQGLSGLKALKHQKQQPYGIHRLPGNVFWGLWNLKQLFLSSNKLYSLNSMPLFLLHNFTYLEMRDVCNGKAQMPNARFSSLSKLITSVLENFGLTEIQTDIFNNPPLWDLVLTKNMIQTIPSDIDKFLPRLHFLDIRFNPLACVCANEPFQLWAIHSRVHVILFYYIKCPPSRATNNKMEFFVHGQPAVCADPAEFLAFIISTTVLTGVLGGGLGYGKGKWYFLYGYYMLRIWLKDIQLRKTVFEQLVPRLENGGEENGGGRPCQLCLHHCDFQAGQTIVSNIVEAVYSSRKTPCVVSPYYFNNEWCSMEVALYWLFDEHNDLLVLLFLEAPPTWALSSFHKLRRVVHQRTYLQRPSDPCQQKVFRARLWLSLQLPERNNMENSCLL